MKKIFALILALVMALSLAACGGDKDNTVAGGNTDSTNNATGTVNNSAESTQRTTEDTTEINFSATTPSTTELTEATEAIDPFPKDTQCGFCGGWFYEGDLINANAGDGWKYCCTQCEKDIFYKIMLPGGG